MANSVNSIWTADRIEQLVSLQKRHWSCSQIAAELGNGITRNAVIGKLHRMGISGGDNSVTEQERLRRYRASQEGKQQRRKEKRREASGQKPARVFGVERAFVPPIVCMEVGPLGVSLLDLEEGDCRYPDGEGSEITFCGHPKAFGRSYCLPHARLTLNSERCWTRGKLEASRRERRAKFNGALLEAAE